MLAMILVLIYGLLFSFVNSIVGFLINEKLFSVIEKSTKYRELLKIISVILIYGIISSVYFLLPAFILDFLPITDVKIKISYVLTFIIGIYISHNCKLSRRFLKMY